MEKKTGKVTKGLGGLYTVRIEENGAVSFVQCRARGSIRNDTKVAIGDNVLLEGENDTLVISEIIKRRNSLIRPPMANLDYLFILFAPENPKPALATIDKLTAIAVHNGIHICIIITKNDISENAAYYADIYKKSGFDTFTCDAVTENGTHEIKSYILNNIANGKTAAFAGASGVGKSTLLNSLFPKLELQTGEISKKILRGRHTTRHVELFELEAGKCGSGFIADTPGFSMLDFEHFDFFTLEDLLPAFPDLCENAVNCRYSDCTHTKETECGVSQAIRAGIISKSRHESYLELYKILKQKNYK